MGGLGAALFVSPGTVDAVWPWALTPLTGRAVGAWLLGLGVAAGHMALGNDLRRIRGGLAAYAVLSVLQLVALGRYPDAVDWAGASAWVYVAFLAGLAAAGLAGTASALRPR